MGSAEGNKMAMEAILLVDDNATNLQFLFETLKGRGYRVLTAKSGEQALTIAGRIPPAMLLLDIMMPGIDGFETCRRLKAETEDAAVIFLSALDETKDKVKVKGLELGAVDYITKPLDPDEVVVRVETHLKIRRLDLEAAAPVQQSFLPQSPPDIPAARFAWTYRPCDELGGDYLNAFAFDERYVGMYVVDVCGHGIPPSLLAVSIARTLSPQPSDTSHLTEPGDGPAGRAPVSPARVAERLSELYTMDTRERRFEFVSAGCPDPMLMRAMDGIEAEDFPGSRLACCRTSSPTRPSSNSRRETDFICMRMA
jgi:sigma-B regulation protein RsbU (phosphoserine phosphatase)